MSLEDRLAEIKKQPEHIRMRYLLACVIISMSVVLIIWVISLKQTFQQVSRELPLQEIPNKSSFDNALDDLRKQQEIIKTALPKDTPEDNLEK